MIYVMSDIHGCYDLYKKMLKKIHFSDEDTLYIIGDVLDRGPEPIKILQDMMKRSNIYPIFGNHELNALPLLKELNVEITDENYNTHLTGNTMIGLSGWLFDGGQTTIDGFKKLNAEQKSDILDYIESFSLYEVVEVNDITYLLIHAGLCNFEKGKKISEYTPFELTCLRPNYDEVCFDDPQIKIIVGHTPTVLISGNFEIYHGKQYIAIDCGACFNGGRLSCICLDTNEEYYVE